MDCYFYFFDIELRELFVYLGDQSLVGCFICKYVLPSCGLSFCFVYGFICCAEVNYILNKYLFYILLAIVYFTCNTIYNSDLYYFPVIGTNHILLLIYSQQFILYHNFSVSQRLLQCNLILSSLRIIFFFWASFSLFCSNSLVIVSWFVGIILSFYLLFQARFRGLGGMLNSMLPHFWWIIFCFFYFSFLSCSCHQSVCPSLFPPLPNLTAPCKKYD